MAGLNDVSDGSAPFEILLEPTLVHRVEYPNESRKGSTNDRHSVFHRDIHAFFSLMSPF